MAYKATRDVNTDFGNYKKGDVVSDILGARYTAFKKVEEVVEPVVEEVVEPVVEEVVENLAKQHKKSKKEKNKKELLVEEPVQVEVEITEE